MIIPLRFQRLFRGACSLNGSPRMASSLAVIGLVVALLLGVPAMASAAPTGHAGPASNYLAERSSDIYCTRSSASVSRIGSDRTGPATSRPKPKCQSTLGRGGPVRWSVVDRNTGRPLTAFPHRGERYVVGTPGHQYAVKLTNRSPDRVLVVLSVDGVNAISGETASPDQSGYVLEPWQDATVSGWRKSQQSVAQFEFTDFADSYANRTGRPAHVGVIGIAVFRERGWDRSSVAISPPGTAERASSDSRSNSFLGNQSARSPLGTGHGAREYSPVSLSSFDRERRPVQIDDVRYDSRPNLIEQGVLPYTPPARPNPWPGQFVPDPPGR